MESNNTDFGFDDEIRNAFPELYESDSPVSYDIDSGESDSLENEEAISEDHNAEIEEAEFEEVEENEEDAEEEIDLDTEDEDVFGIVSNDIEEMINVEENEAEEIISEDNESVLEDSLESTPNTEQEEPEAINIPYNEEEDDPEDWAARVSAAIAAENMEPTPTDVEGSIAGDLDSLNNINAREFLEVPEISSVVISPENVPMARDSNIEEVQEEENNTDVVTYPIEEESIYDDLVPIQYSRFKGADWFTIAQEQEVILAGLGGIGSWTNIFLSRLGLKELILFDSDVFESHNMSGQAVTVQDVRVNKAEAAGRHAYNFSHYRPSIFNSHYREEDDPITTKVMICGFDNMKARQEFYAMWKKDIDPKNPQDYLFIDGRLTAEIFQIFVIKGNDTYAQKEYQENWLFDDDIADDTDCTLKQTTHLAAMIASFIVNHFVNWCSSFSESNTTNLIPWLTEYNSLLNSHNYEY